MLYYIIMLSMINKLYKKFKKLSDLKKLGVILVSYLLIKYIMDVLRWNYWNSGYMLEGLSMFGGGKPSKIILFHMNGCGHCKRMMPEWDKFHSNNNTGITSQKIEQSENPALVEKYKIQGFPTIILVDDSGKKLKTYDGERTADAFSSFCAKSSN